MKRHTPQQDDPLLHRAAAKAKEQVQQNELAQDDDADQTAGEEQTGLIKDVGSLTHTKGKHVIHCLTVIGQIEGHFILPAQNKTTKYEHVIPQLVAIEQDPQIEGLVILLNTVGGDVEAGLAIAELIAGMRKPTVSLVLGGGHSIGVPLAVSADYSFIAPSATMTIHPVRMTGLVVGAPQTFSYFEKMQDRIVRFTTQNSRIPEARLRDLMMQTGEMVMDVGTVLDGEQAVEEGLIAPLGGLSDAVAKLYELIEARQGDDGDAGAPPTEKKSPSRRTGAGAAAPGQTKGKRPAPKEEPPKKKRGRPPKGGDA